MMIERATSARLPAAALAALASLRSSEGISVILGGEHAWVFWELGDPRALRAIYPVPGVELYEQHGHAWHRVGWRLPSFEESPSGEVIPLSRAVTPAPFVAEPPGGKFPSPLPLRLRRDARPRPTTAAVCSLAELGSWADSALTCEISAIRAAINGNSTLLVGRGLPSWPGSTRYWGGQLLIPIGYTIRPSLPEATILEALGDPARELLRVVSDCDGQDLAVEAIPLEAFRPLTRAGVRLAIAGAITS